MTNLDNILKSRDIILPTKVCIVKAMVFPVVMYGCESWTIKKAEHRRTDAFELWCWRRLLRVPWIARISSLKNSFHPKGNQSWIFIGRTDVEAGAPILWLPDAKSWLIRKDPDAGKDWWQEEKGMTEDEMVGCHHQLEGHNFKQTPGVGDGQGSLACCTPWGCKESDMTEWLNWTETTKNQVQVSDDQFCGLNTEGDTKWKLEKNQLSIWALCIYILLKIWSFSSLVGYFFFYLEFGIMW